MPIPVRAEAPHCAAVVPPAINPLRRRAERRAATARLRSLHAFAGCSTHELTAIAPLFDQVTIAAGASITRQGGASREVAILVDGTAAVVVDGATIAAVGPGDIVGEIGPLARSTRTASVVATTEVVALVTIPRDFLTMLDRSPRFARNVLATVAARHRGGDRRE